MAAPLTKKQVNQLPIKNIMPQTGDIFFCSGPYLSSKIVQFYTKSPWSHCGFIWQTDRGNFCLDAMMDSGVRVMPLEHYTRPVQGFLYDGPVVLGRWSGLDSNCADYMIEWVLKQLSEPNDVLDYIRLWLRALCGIFTLPPYKGEKGFQDKWLCSELVGSALHVAGYPHKKDGKSFTTPALLWQHSNLEMVGRIA
jgi:hypothetical protein